MGFKGKIHDVEIGKRLARFRTEFVHKNQTKAAKLLDVPQSSLSLMERAFHAISLNLVTKLITDYKLNSEWLSTGNGGMLDKNPAKKGLVTDIGKVSTEVNLIQRNIKMLEVTQTHLMKHIKRMEDEIEGLKKRLDEK